jgi:hypothetical protein
MFHTCPGVQNQPVNAKPFFRGGALHSQIQCSSLLEPIGYSVKDVSPTVLAETVRTYGSSKSKVHLTEVVILTTFRGANGTMFEPHRSAGTSPGSTGMSTGSRSSQHQAASDRVGGLDHGARNSGDVCISG